MTPRRIVAVVLLAVGLAACGSVYETPEVKPVDNHAISGNDTLKTARETKCWYLTWRHTEYYGFLETQTHTKRTSLGIVRQGATK